MAATKKIKTVRSAALPAACNVLSLDGEQQQFWRFAPGRGEMNLVDVQAGRPEDPLPIRHTHKVFSNLWSRRLNIAWLPPERVFYSVLQLPQCARDELAAMVELQMEKISPLPPAQTVWTMEVVPARGMLPPETQTVVVAIAARAGVEELLGQLEQKNYLTDGIEVPALQQVLAAREDVDGVWLYPQMRGEQVLCLVAWWSAGVLQHLTQITLTSAGQMNELAEHLTCSTWAGEMAGWLAAPMTWHLVAEGDLATAWSQMLGQWLGEPVEIVQPLPMASLAAATARHAGRARPADPALLPVEFKDRYRRDFVDRVWLRGMAATFLVYLVLLAAFIVTTEVLKTKQEKLAKELGPIARDSTNVLQLGEQIVQLQEQLALRNAALDGFRMVGDKLPADLSLDQFTFSKGEKVVLRGTAPAAMSDKIEEYTEALKTVKSSSGQPLFQKVYPANFNRVQGGTALQWSFTCDLRRREEEP